MILIKHACTNILLLLLCFVLCLPTFAAVTSTTSVVTVQGGYSKRAPVSDIVNITAVETAGVKAGATLTVAESGTGFVHQTILTLADTTFTFVDDGSTGHVATKIYDLPEGYIQTLGASTDLACTSAGTFGATGTAVFSIGTTATADSTLDSTDANIIASTSSGAFVASEGTLLGGPVSAPLQIDGHSTAADVYLNLGDASDPSDDSVLTCSGTITLTWMGHGDN